MPITTPKERSKYCKFQHYSAQYYRGYTLYWIILIIVFIGLGSLPFITIDVSVQSRGNITSFKKNVSIASPLTARVVACAIGENQKVNRGDTLIILHQTGLQNEMALNYQQITLQQHYISDLTSLLSRVDSDELITPLYQKEQDNYLSTINTLGGVIQKRQIDFDRTTDLYKDGVVPLTTFQEDSFKLDAAHNELTAYKTSSNARWESERRNYVLAIHKLESRIENLRQQQNQYVITAPLSGSIIDFTGLAPGYIINENERIAYLSPHDDLVAECYITPADIGFIHEGMEVQLQIDTYDYNQWGLLAAQVVDVADDVIVHNGEYRYLIRCHLSEKYLEMKNGVIGNLKKGMSLTGRFVITQRTLFQLLFDNVDDWLNPKVMTESNMPKANTQ